MNRTVTRAGSHAVPEYRTLQLSTRPPRVAVLFQAHKDWIHIATRIFENFSRIWGGAGNILLPCTQNGDLPEPFWPVLEAFDPDLVGWYQETHQDRKLADPVKFEEWLVKGARVLAAKSGRTIEEERSSIVDSGVLSSPLSDWRPSESTSTRIVRHLAPLAIADNVFSVHFHADMEPSWQLPDVTSFPPPFPTLIEFDTGELDPLLKVMLASRAGGVAPSHRKALLANGGGVDLLEVTQDDIPPLLEACWRGCLRPDRRRYTRHQRAGARHGRGDDMWSISLPPERFPLARSIAHCDWYSRWNVRWLRRPCVLVVGDGVEDFCYAVAMDRLTGRAYWVPAICAKDRGEMSVVFRRELSQELASVVRDGMVPSEVVTTSITLAKDTLAQVCDSLGEVARRTLAARDARFVPRLPQDVQIPSPRRLLHARTSVLPSSHAFVDGELAGQLQTPIPQGFEDADPLSLSWFVDVDVNQYKLPVRSCLADSLETAYKSGACEIRPSTGGMSYFSHPHVTRGGDRLDLTVVRPCLRLPAPYEVFQRLLAHTELLLEYSDKGRYMLAALELWGGLDPLAEDLADPARNSLLEAYRPGKKDKTAPGVYLSGVQRRFLSFEDIKTVTGLAPDHAREVADAYLRRGILARGLWLLCPQCKFAGWYAVEELGQSFRCQRCRKESLILKECWKQQPEEAPWYYELVEVVYQAVNHNTRGPVLGLALLQRDAEAFEFTPELRVLNMGKKPLEVDIWALVDGKIVIGEANTTGQLESRSCDEQGRLKKLRQLADELTADEVVFATTHQSWRPGTRANIEEAFSDSRTSPVFYEKLGAGQE